MPDGDDSTPAPYAGGGRGAGGKLRRERKPPPTPYDRPPRRDTGWLSRIVTPARRIISGGATLLLPSYFSPATSAAEEDSGDATPDEDGQREVDQDTRNQNESSPVDVGVTKSTGEVSLSEAKGKAIVVVSDEDAEDKTRDSDGLPDIEQLIKGKTFSREEVDRLMGILRSRVADAEKEKELTSKSGQEDVERAETSSRKQKVAVDVDEESDKFKSASSTPFPRLPVSKMPNDIGASPVDIARAYMGSRTSEVGFASNNSVLRNEKFSLGSELSSKALMQSPLQKTPVRWPGSMTQDQQGYSTPQSQKSRYGLQSFPRTPYSRTIYPKSKPTLTPLLRDNERLANMSPSPFQSIRSSAYGKTASNAAEGIYGTGTGGPIRRVRHNSTSTTPARESPFSRTVQPSLFRKESATDVLFRKNFEPGTSSTPIFESATKNSEITTTPGVVHPHSSKLARQILEQLDKPITLKERSEELKLAVSWKNKGSPPKDTSATTAIFNGSDLLTGAGKSTNTESAKLPAETNGLNSFVPRMRSDVFGARNGTLDKATGASNIGPSSSKHSLDPQKTTPDQGTSDNLPKGNGQPFLTGDQSKHRRPILPSISIDKPGLRTTASDTTSSGFTFPFATSSSMSSEPPTPSIIPSTSPEKPKPSPSPSPPFPSFTFGNKITIAPPVNAFSSSSNTTTTTTTTTLNDSQAPKYKFGSGKTTRLSFAIEGEEVPSPSNDSSSLPKYKFGAGQGRLNFGSIGNDAVCC